jgi:hypothetical protein
MSPTLHSDESGRGAESGHENLRREFQRRQENVLPLDAARNQGRFYGLVTLGKGPFTGAQRVGILLVAISLLGFGLVMLASSIPPSILGLSEPLMPGAEWPPSPSVLLGICISLIVGLRFSWVALRRQHPRQTH